MLKNVRKSKPFNRILKKRTTPTGGLFLGRASFYAFKTDFG